MAISNSLSAAMLIFLAGVSCQTLDAQLPEAPQDKASASADPTAASRATVLTLAAHGECLMTSTNVKEGYALLRAGRFAESLAKLQSVNAALEQNGAGEPVPHACLKIMIGYAELMRGGPGVAVKWFERALTLKPLPDAFLAVISTNLAAAYLDLKQLDRAELLARQAIQLASRAFGPESPDALRPQETLAEVYSLRGDYASAEPMFRRILAQTERTSGASYAAAHASGNLGFIHFVERRYATARPLLEKALAGSQANPIGPKEDIPLIQTALSISCAATGRDRDARTFLEQALAYSQRELQSDDPLLTVIFERAAIARFMLKDHESGRELFDRTITLLETRFGAGSQPVLDGLERYAASCGRRKIKGEPRPSTPVARL